MSLFRCLLLLGALAVSLRAQTTFFYGGDLTPSEGSYAPLFTTLGPGHPTGAYFVGTTWSSDGNVLTMTTQNPNYGGQSLGIWFGLGNGYGDDPSISLSTSTLGNNVTTRLALAANSGEWSLYWYDASGRGAVLYFEAAGFTYYFSNPSAQTGSDAFFVPRADMTSFHTFGTHVFENQVSYYLDGSLLGTGTALPAGVSSLLVFGDGSAGDISGYGSLLVDSLSITTSAGAAPIPETATTGLALATTALATALFFRRRKVAERVSVS